MRACVWFVAIGFGTTLLAQSFSATVVSPGLLTAQTGPHLQSTVIPAGAVSSLHLSASAGSTPDVCQAVFDLNTSANATGGRFDLTLFGSVAGSLPASATVSPLSVLAVATAPQPTTVRLELREYQTLVSGGIVPNLRVDVGDDGSYELSLPLQAQVDIPLVIDPVGVPIRIEADLPLSVVGSVTSALQMRIVPPDVVQVINFGCTGLPTDVQTDFQGNVLFNEPYHFVFWFPVLGLSVHPVQLPSLSPLCFLIPTPDAVLFTSPFVTTYGIQVPAAVRPVAFYAQDVLFDSTGFSTTDAVRIQLQ